MNILNLPTQDFHHFVPMSNRVCSLILDKRISDLTSFRFVWNLLSVGSIQVRDSALSLSRLYTKKAVKCADPRDRKVKRLLRKLLQRQRLKIHRTMWLPPRDNLPAMSEVRFEPPCSCFYSLTTSFTRANYLPHAYSCSWMQASLCFKGKSVCKSPISSGDL